MGAWARGLDFWGLGDYRDGTGTKNPQAPVNAGLIFLANPVNALGL